MAPSNKTRVNLILVAILIGLILYYFSTRITSPSQKPTTNLIPPAATNREEVEKWLLSVSTENMTDQEKNPFREKAIAIAQSVDLVEISNCKANPAVTKVDYKQSIVLKNLDKTDLKLVFRKDSDPIEIPAQETFKIVPSDLRDPNQGPFVVFRYRCVGMTSDYSGAFYITNIPTPTTQ